MLCSNLHQQNPSKHYQREQQAEAAGGTIGFCFPQFRRPAWNVEYEFRYDTHIKNGETVEVVKATHSHNRVHTCHGSQARDKEMNWKMYVLTF